MIAIVPQNQTQPKKEQFFMVTPEELKQSYKAKIFNTEAYLYCLIRAKRTAGWEWYLNVKQFCVEWEIRESTFYRALSKLRVKNVISWRSGDNTVVVWWDKKVSKIANVDSSDSPNSPNLYTGEALQDVREPLQDVRVPLQHVRVQNPETLAVALSCNPSYSLQIDPKINTDFHEEVCVGLEKTLDEDPESEQWERDHQKFYDHEHEINQDPIPEPLTTLLEERNQEPTHESCTTLLEGVETSQNDETTHEGKDSAAPPVRKNDETNQDAINESCTTLLGEAEPLQVAKITSSEGKGFARPIRKTSQKQEWICPGTEEEKEEFFIFKAKLLVDAQLCKQVEARAMAISWADSKPKAANALFQEWQKLKLQDANPNTAIETVPEFRRMDKQEHLAVLEKFINHTKQEFLKLCWWHEYWLEFASRQFRLRQELIPELTPEIIQKIKA